MGSATSCPSYRSSATYADLERLPNDAPVLYVDFSGDETSRQRIHRHFGDALVYDCYAGSAQTRNFQRETTLPGPAPQIYFAPVQIRKRNADWGPAVVNQRFGDAQRRFIRHVGAAGRLSVIEHEGFEAAAPLIEALCAGRADPALGHGVRLS